MKLKIYDTSDNAFVLLVNLICENSHIFEKPENYVVNKLDLHKDMEFRNHVGQIRITEVKKVRTFEDVIDKTYETVIIGKAHVGLNIFVDFRLMTDYDVFATLDMIDSDGNILNRILLEL